MLVVSSQYSFMPKYATITNANFKEFVLHLSYILENEIIKSSCKHFQKIKLRIWQYHK